VRSSNWHKDGDCSYAWEGALLSLSSHDGYEKSIAFETVGIFLFDARTPLSVNCFGGSYVEIGQVEDIRSSPYALRTHSTINTLSGKVSVFGSVTSYAGADSVSVRPFSRISEVNNIYVVLQEDKCKDEETNHPYETLPFMIATFSSSGCSSASDPVVSIRTDQPTASPTPAPSPLPTPPPSHYPTVEVTLVDVGSGTITTQESELLLAILLPISTIFLIAIVGFFVNKYYIGAGACAEESSEHSGLALVGGVMDYSDRGSSTSPAFEDKSARSNKSIEV